MSTVEACVRLDLRHLLRAADQLVDWVDRFMWERKEG